MALGSLIVKIVGDASSFNKTIAQTQKELNKQTKGLEVMAKSMTTVGDSMTKGITLPILAVGAGLLKLGESFDAAYDTIRVGTGKTGKELEALNDDFRAVAKVAPSAFGDIGMVIADLNKRLGLTGKPLQEMATQMLNIARITKTDINTLIPAATRVFGDWGIATDKQGKALDTLFKVSQTTGIGVDSLSEKVVQLGAPLRNLGYSFEEATALMGKWEKEGVNTETVFSGLRQALRVFAKEGVTDTKTALMDIIERMKNAGTTGEAASIGMAYFGKGLNDVVDAARGGKFDIAELVNTIENSTDSINAASEATMDWQEKLILLRNNVGLAIEPLATKVFESLGRAVDGVTPSIEAIAKKFGDLSPTMQDNLLKWGLMTAVIPPVISLLGRAMTGAIQFRKALLLLSSATLGVAGGLAVVSTAIYEGTKLWGEWKWQTQETKDKVVDLNSALKTLQNTQRNNAGATQEDNDKLKILGELAKKYPELADEVIKLAAEEDAAVKSSTDVITTWDIYRDKINDLADAYGPLSVRTIAAAQAQRENRDATVGQIIANQNNEATIKSLMEQTGKTREEVVKYAIEQELLETATDDTTDSTEEQAVADNALAAAKEALITATNTLYDSLFNEYLLNADISEGLKAAQNAYDEYTKAVEKHGIKSDEARQKEEAWIRIIDGLTSTQIPELINKTGALTSEEIKHLNGMQNQIDKAKELGIVTPEEWAKISKSINDKIQGSINKDFGDMHNKMTELGKLHVSPSVGLDTSEFYSKLAQTGRAFAEAYSKYGRAEGGPVGFSKGGFLDKIISASAGINLPKFDNGGVLAILHPPEVVLNKDNALNILWNLTKPIPDTKQVTNTKQEVTIHVPVNMDGKTVYEVWEKYDLRAKGERV